VKAAKAWLYNAGLIEYVQTRCEGGLLGEVYIKLSFLPRAETVAERMKPVIQEEPAAVEEFRDDLTPDLFEQAEPITGGSETDPVVTGGSVYGPAVDRTPGAKQQMLKVNNEMLEMKKGKGDDAPEPAEPEPESKHFPIANAWFNRYARETAIMIAPRPDDYKAAAELFAAMGGDLSGLETAIEAYFGGFRELGLWFAARKSSRRGDPSAWTPDWSFRSFVSHYPEIIAAATIQRSVGSVATVVHPDPMCPVCGHAFLGMMATCATCGIRLEDIHDHAKVEDHREWFEDLSSLRHRADMLPIDLQGEFKRHIGAVSA